MDYIKFDYEFYRNNGLVTVPKIVPTHHGLWRIGAVLDGFESRGKTVRH